MDAFEKIVTQLLIEEGYWTIIGYKVDISQAHADSLEKSSMPRPEIDIVAYKPELNLVYLIEVKSYIDSSGVSLKPFEDLETNKNSRYKLLTHKKYRDIVSKLVKEDLLKKGLISDMNIQVEMGLMVGNLYQTTESDIKAHFEDKGYPNWIVWGPETIKEKIKALARKGYENNEVVMISKLLHPDERKAGATDRKKKRKET